MDINLPDVLAEVTHAFQCYEAALMANDLDALNALFWQSPMVVRFGPGQNLYGIEAIAAFRTARIGGSPKRVLSHTVITSFGRAFATANTEFLRENTDIPGRQTQGWVRFEDGWRIVSAHVSLLGIGS
jgi:ketosteroid isomerase-like protein